MKLPEQHIRIVAGAPIEAGARRLLPSVLVTQVRKRWGDSGLFHTTRLRPVSVVVEGSDSAEWIEIPDATAQALSTMMVAAATIGVVGSLILVLSRLLGRR